MEWWQEGVMYEVYVRSFRDTDGDGIGDCRASSRSSARPRDARRARPDRPGRPTARLVHLAAGTAGRAAYELAQPCEQRLRTRCASGWVDQPEMAEVAAFLRAVVDELPDRILVAEMACRPRGRSVTTPRSTCPVPPAPALAPDVRMGPGLVTQHESSGDELVYDREVDGRRHRVVARIEDGKRTMALPVPGRVLLRAHRPEPEAPVLVDAVTLAGPDAAVVELAAG